MANFNEHLLQVRKNLDFLEFTNSSNSSWDWKVTISFYAGVHLINSHIAQTSNLHFRSHKEVDIAISSASNNISVCKLDEDTYYAYKALYNLSRRSRYLIHDDPEQRGESDCLQTFDKHYKRAIQHLDVIIDFINKTYNHRFEKTKVKCVELKPAHNLQHFTIVL